MEENNNTVHFHFKINEMVYIMRNDKIYHCIITEQRYRKTSNLEEKTYNLKRDRKGGTEEFFRVKEHEIFGNVADLKNSIEVVMLPLQNMPTENVEALQPFYEAGNAI